MPAEVGLFGATALSPLAEFVIALGVIALRSVLAGRLMDVFARWISSPLSEAKDDANAR
jgi:hypothetical protein